MSRHSSISWIALGTHPVLRFGVGSALLVFLTLAALCPLPVAAGTRDQAAWSDRAAVPMACPFHPGRAATLSSALQFSLQHAQAIPGDAASPMPAGLPLGAVFAADEPEPFASALPPPRRPAPVPLYLLHAALIR